MLEEVSNKNTKNEILKANVIKQELTTKYEYESKLAQTKVDGEIKVYT